MGVTRGLLHSRMLGIMVTEEVITNIRGNGNFQGKKHIIVHGVVTISVLLEIMTAMFMMIMLGVIAIEIHQGLGLIQGIMIVTEAIIITKISIMTTTTHTHPEIQISKVTDIGSKTTTSINRMIISVMILSAITHIITKDNIRDMMTEGLRGMGEIVSPTSLCAIIQTSQ